MNDMTTSSSAGARRPGLLRRPSSATTAIIVAGIVFMLAPFAIYPVLLMEILCFALFSCAFNLLLGYGGMLSFGHAMFFGGAAYVSGNAIKVAGLSPELGILAGTGFAAVLGLLTGILAIRRIGIYFAMVTLALAQMFYFLCLQMPFTNGENGLQEIPRRPLFGLVDLTHDVSLYYFVLAVCVIGSGVIYRAVHSPFGHVLKAIRENERRAVSLGYDVARHKLLAFVLSATIAGLAGSTKVMIFQLASLTDVSWHMSGEVVLMTMVGGVATTIGPLVGAAVIIAMQNYLAGYGDWVLIMQGIIFVVVVSLFRRGIVGELATISLTDVRRSLQRILLR